MWPPTRLYNQIFILACEPQPWQLYSTGAAELRYVMRAAALLELQNAGRLTDESGLAVIADPTPVDEEYLDDLLRQITGRRPHKWRSWIAHAQDDLTRAVEQLEGAGWIRVERSRRLRVIPDVRITVADPAWRLHLVRTIETALTSPAPVNPHDAALAAIAGAAAIPKLMSWRRRWTHRERLRELIRQVGPIPRAMRSVLGAHRTRFIS